MAEFWIGLGLIFFVELAVIVGLLWLAFRMIRAFFNSKYQSKVADHDARLKFIPSKEGYSRAEARMVEELIQALQLKLDVAQTSQRTAEVDYRHHRIEFDALENIRAQVKNLEEDIEINTKLADYFGGQSRNVQAKQTTARGYAHSIA